MKRHMYGQCNTSDFRQLDHLAEWLARGEEVDFTNLTKRQMAAVIVLKHFQERGENIELCLKLKEVLVYEEEDGKVSLEFKLLDPKDTTTRDKLRAMRSIQPIDRS